MTIACQKRGVEMVRPIPRNAPSIEAYGSDRETACWTSDGTLLRPELCNNEIVLDPCRIRLPVPLIPFVSSLIGTLLPRFLNLEWMAERFFNPPKEKVLLYTHRGELPGKLLKDEGIMRL
ncbi:hypothetical protein Tco_0301861, partial [Tanacetum coccineum]